VSPFIILNSPQTNKKAHFLMTEFLDQNHGMWASKVDENKWTSLFRTGLRLELALFDAPFRPY
jgi:seryl-tRNA synthetase